ncbi:MAG TPA: endonuclease/exonuclease/phosphatase family protein [Chroococcales cyanobacterium]
MGSLILLLIVGWLLSIASFCGQYNNICEILSHLRPVLCAAAAVLALLCLICGNLIAALAGLLLVLLNGEPILQLHLPAQQPVIETSTPRLKILQMNLWGGRNHYFDRAVQIVRDENPDIVCFSENTATWSEPLKERLPDYRYLIGTPQYSGISIFSRIPLQQEQLKYFGAKHRPRVQTRLKIGKRTVTLIFVHPEVPFGPQRYRNEELAEITADVKGLHEPVILAGDMNCTPWSYYFDKLKEDTQLRDTEQGIGMQPSWSAFWPVPLFPIDHYLVSKEFATVSRHVGHRFGSDHFPVFVELALPASPETEPQ